jgi:hypothetical protein
MKTSWLEYIFGCYHHWEILNDSVITQYGVTQGKMYILKCDKCGDLKNKKFVVGDLY